MVEVYKFKCKHCKQFCSGSLYLKKTVEFSAYYEIVNGVLELQNDLSPEDGIYPSKDDFPKEVKLEELSCGSCRYDNESGKHPDAPLVGSLEIVLDDNESKIASLEAELRKLKYG